MFVGDTFRVILGDFTPFSLPLIMAPYRIMATAIDAFGHINSVLGFTEGLQQTGHEIVFVHRERYRSLAVKRGFSFMPLDHLLPHEDEDREKLFFNWIDMIGEKFRQSPEDRCKGISYEAQQASAKQANLFFDLDQALDQIVANNTFDLIIVDFPAPMPFLYRRSAPPWIPLASINPLVLYPSGPPPFSGYSVHSNKTTWQPFTELYQKAHSLLTQAHNRRLESLGLTTRFNPAVFVDHPPHFGFYHYPADLDYAECSPRREHWFRIDAWIRQPDLEANFVLPESLKNRPGKLIYFSLGSLGSADLVLMRRLLSILAQSPHKFIVSKGPRGNQLDLAPNMWGQNYLNQIAILPTVDLVITHGGNNTFLETLYHGKPMIVIPYFYDQFDNAQRVVDKQIGFRVNPYNLDASQLLEYIEKALADRELASKVQTISCRMRQSTSLQQSVKRIESLMESFDHRNNQVPPPKRTQQ